MDRGILSFGAYVPRLRIDRAAIAAANSWAFPSVRGKGARALANWDEDAITMSVEAARGLGLERVGGVAFASTNPPFADFQNATLVAAALALPDTVATADYGGSLRAGSSALLAALESSRERSTLVVAADARHAKPGSAQELQYGAGAVAFEVGTGDLLARLVGQASRADAFVDHFRTTGEKYEYHWEERWVRDEGYAKILPGAIKQALDQAGLSGADVAHFCLPTLLRGVAASVAKRCGIAADAVADDLQLNCGDTGAAHGPLLLAAALERAKPGERIMLVTFGAGCEVLLFEATDALAGYTPGRSVAATLAAGHVEQHYTKLLSFQGELALDWGMRAEFNEKVALTQQYRARGQLANFTAGVCGDCDAVQFPQLASCTNCGSFAPFTQRSLVDEPADVFSFTADWLQYHPSPPLYFGLVNFDCGARVMMEFVDVDRATLQVGTKLRMVYRVKSMDGDRHYGRYFWKAAPIADTGE